MRRLLPGTKKLGAVLLLVIATAVVSACGSTPGDGGGTPEPPAVLSIEEALAVDPGQDVSVQGSLVATGSGADQKMVLASVLLESYPPQAGGATLPLEGLDLDSIVGLSSTIGQPELAPVTWSDFWLVLSGPVTDGTLKVEGTPQVFEASAGDVRVRFSPVSEPIKTGEPVWWAFDVKNGGSAPFSLTFSSGQRADVVLSQNGVEKYRWSDGKSFTQAIETVMIKPGDTLPVVLNDTLQVAPGEYDFVATVTGAAGSQTGGAPLPEIIGKISVF